MKLSEMHATLKEIGVSPVKSLGQNFLHDQNLARWIVDQAQITAEDYVVEIGPGLGALTRFLLEKGAHVLAIEKDARLAEFLRSRFGDERLEIVNTDALKFDPRILFAHRRTATAKTLQVLHLFRSPEHALLFPEETWSTRPSRAQSRPHNLPP